MAKDLGPHVVARAPKRREIQARPTCELDRNELLGLVRSSTAEPVPRSKRETDLDVSVEVISTTETTPAPMPKARTVRVVQTVRRATKIAPLRVAPTGTDVSIPAAPPIADSSDSFADMFAETLGAEPVATPNVHTAGSGTQPQLESAAQDIPTEVAATDFDAFGDTAMFASIPPPVASPGPTMLRPLSIDDTAPAQALVDVPIAAPEPVAEPVTTPVVAAPHVRQSPSLVKQIAIGVVLGCVGLGVYLGIAAS
jgi:hypothetical protein